MMECLFNENYIKENVSIEHIETNEYGTDIYIATVQVGLISGKIPIQYDMRLRYNKAEKFLDISPADGYNVGTSMYSEDSFVIPATITEFAHNYVSQIFTHSCI